MLKSKSRSELVQLGRCNLIVMAGLVASVLLYGATVDANTGEAAKPALVLDTGLGMTPGVTSTTRDMWDTDIRQDPYFDVHDEPEVSDVGTSQPCQISRCDDA